MFFGILMKHFPEGSELAKIFNKKTVKLSYCCMPNMKSIISGHNKKILRGEKPAYPVKKDCNCRGGVPTCPLEGKCQTKSLVYRAEVTSREGMKEYLGQASNTFKFRYNGHTDSFRNEHKEKDTTLSKYLWQLKRKEEVHEIKWYIASLAIPYTRETKRCQLQHGEDSHFLPRFCKGIKQEMGDYDKVQTQRQALTHKLVPIPADSSPC